MQLYFISWTPLDIGELGRLFVLPRRCDHGYVNTGPAHMPNGLYDRLEHDERLAERGERDES